MLRPNGLAFSGRLECITLIDREGGFIVSGYQNRPDPVAPLERRVGLLNRSSMAFSSIKRAALRYEIPFGCGTCGMVPQNKQACTAVFAPALLPARCERHHGLGDCARCVLVRCNCLCLRFLHLTRRAVRAPLLGRCRGVPAVTAARRRRRTVGHAHWFLFFMGGCWCAQSAASCRCAKGLCSGCRRCCWRL